jgi:hypothetical protein
MINPSQHKPEGAASLQDPERNARLAWAAKVRTMHRNKRMIGFAGIILGASLVTWARLSPGQAPGWALTAGFGVLAVSWVLFIYVIVDRWRWVKNNPYRPRTPPPA